MLFHRLQLAVVISSALFVRSMPARAQSSEAAALFDAGVADMLAGRFEKACPAIARSFDLEPLPGALFTLAECLAGQGKTASALARYSQFQALVATLPAERRPAFDEREALAFRQMARLRERAPALLIVAPPGEDLPTVTINGDPLEASAFGVERSLDPGSYEVIARSGARPAWRSVVVLTEGKHERLAIPALQPRAQVSTEAEHEDERPRRSSASRPWMYAAGAVGLTGLVVGTGAGILAWSHKSDVDEHCPEHVCDAEGRRALDSGRSAARVSNIGLAVGAAGLVSAGVLYLLQPRAEAGAARRTQPRVSVSASSASFSVEGAF